MDCPARKTGQRWKCYSLPDTQGITYDFTLGAEVSPGVWLILNQVPSHGHGKAPDHWWDLAHKNYVMVLLCAKTHE